MKYLLMFVALVVTTLSVAADRAQTFVGEIADSSCAYNVHSLSRSHKEMLKSKEWGTSAADCTRRCVKKFGASYVLVHGNEVYKLDKQDLADQYAGTKVRVTGKLDDGSKAIEVESIEAAK